MKIQSLHIENIASFEDVTVDFRNGPLGSADVFLISGSVGTGKSTILDCITLALYGKTPRMNGQGGTQRGGKDLTFNNAKITDPRQLLRRGARKGRVTLLFEADGHSFEAVWQTPSTKKGARTLTDLTTRAVLELGKEIDAEIGRIINLDFDQFCRTTTLSQGEFAKFLRSDDNEKAAILEKIAGVELYTRIGAAIYERLSEAQTAVRLSESCIQGITLIADEERQSLTANLAALKERAAVLAAASAKAGQQLKWHEQLGVLTERAKVAAESLTAAEEAEKSDGYLSALRDLTDYEATAEARALTAKGASLRERIALLKESMTQNAQAYSVMLSRFDGLDNNINGLEATRKATEEALVPHQPLLPVYESIKSISELAATFSTATRLAADTGKAIADSERSIAERLRPAAEAAKTATAKCEKEVEETRSAMRTGVAEASALTRPTLDRAAASASETLNSARSELQGATKIYEQMLTAAGKTAKTMRSTLTEGCLCPVCRQKVAALPPAESAIKEALDAAKAEVEKLQKAVEQKSEAHIAALHNCDTLAAEINQTASAIGLPTGEIDHLSVDEADGHQTTAAELAALRSRLVEAQNALARAQKAQMSAEKALSRATDAIATSRGVIATATTQADEAIAKIVAAVSPCGPTYADEATADPQAFASRMAAEAKVYDTLAAKLDTTVRNLDALRQTGDRLRQKRTALLESMPQWESLEAAPTDQPGLDTLETEFDTLRADVSSTLSRIAADREELAAAELSLKTFLSENQAITSERLNALTSLVPAEIRSMRETTERIREAAVKCRGVADECRRQLEEHTKNGPAEPIDADILREAKAAADRELEENGQRTGAISQRLADDEANRREHGRLLEEHAALELRKNEWKQLNDLFGDKEGTKFRRIALSYILDNLIEQANKYMQMLTDRYTLALKPGSFIILVTDAYQGYAQRTSTTISGGETFIVSLALALALSDMGGSIRGADILFIDEGFGSLSGEELHKAVDMLRNLRTTADRRVGIISHIPELAERIPVQLRVTRTGRTAASTITVTS